MFDAMSQTKLPTPVIFYCKLNVSSQFYRVFDVQCDAAVCAVIYGRLN